ncbi:acylphosphatase [Mariniphaga sediminis]|uniref:acylphosphatase n=1 Tax=Mariniphaga sediminis TaxID=1628158 RepID=UPI0035640E42
MIQYEIKVFGRVQGVGFRYFVRQRAAEFNMKGWVRNTPDGNVLVMAQGDVTDMETFLDYLRIGPSLARVTRVTKNEMPALEAFDDFQVKY